MKRLILIALCAAMTLTGCAQGQGKKKAATKAAATEQVVGINEGDMFTDLTIGDVKLSDYVGKGKYILVDFWASWCPPCRAEIPNIANVYKRFAGDQFDVVSIAVWDENEDSISAIKELGMTWNQILGGGRTQSAPLTRTYGIEGIPHIILFGPDGTILKRDLRGAAIAKEVGKYVTEVK